MEDEEGRGNGGDGQGANAQESQGTERAADKGKGDEKILKEMRGWLMTVGTLFVGMAFQAALQPPAWMRTAELLRYSPSEINQFKHPFHFPSHAAATAPAMFAPSPGPSPQAAVSTEGLSARALAYMFCNVITFASALSLVLLLLGEIPRDRAKITLQIAAWTMRVTGLGVVATFALGSSEQWWYTLGISIFIVVYAIFVVHCVRMLAEFFAKISAIRRTGERPAQSPDRAP